MKRGCTVLTLLLLVACAGDKVKGSSGFLRAYTDSVRGVTCYTLAGEADISCLKTDK